MSDGSIPAIFSTWYDTPGIRVAKIHKSLEGYDTPQKFVLRGLNRHKFFIGSATPWKFAQRGIRPHRIRVSKICERLEGYETPLKFGWRGLIPCGNLLQGYDTPQGKMHCRKLFREV